MAKSNYNFLPLFRNTEEVEPNTDTSRLARAAANTTGHRQRVLAAITEAGELGLTNDELVELLAIKTASVTPQTSALKNEKVIVDSGRRRLTRSGCPASVLVLASILEGRDVG